MNQNNRITIYAGPPMQRLIDQVGGAERRSGRINNVCERYEYMIKEELPRLRFTRDEWCAICDVGNGTTIVPGDPGWHWLHASMWDAPEMDDKWGINHEELAQRMRDLSLVGRAAVCEVVERFWSSPNLNQVTNDELLREAGAFWTEPKAAAAL